MQKTTSNPEFCGMYTKPREALNICWKFQCFNEKIATKQRWNKIATLKTFHANVCKKGKCPLLKNNVFMEDK